MKAVFVAGVHTDVGKTHVACAILRSARAAGLSVEALKPVVSGFDAARPEGSDPWRLLEALGVAPSPQTLAWISPWRFAAPLAPPMAARLEGETLDFQAMADLCWARLGASSADLFVVEGVGGLMSPIAQGATGLDLMAALNIPCVLVGGSYLGAISHTLTALKAAPNVAAVVISESAGEAPDFDVTVDTIRQFAGPTPVLPLPRDGTLDFISVLGLA
jgi:dethiobiotin synthetase